MVRLQHQPGAWRAAMAKKKTRTRKDKSEISRSKKTAGATRKTASRKMRAAARVNDKVKAQAAKPAAPKQQPMTKSEIGSARAEGRRLYKLAGRPSKEDVVKVYGTAKAIAWTWVARAKAAGLSSAEEAATQFQSMLAKARA